MSADPLGGAISHHVVPEPDFWLDPREYQDMEQNLDNIEQMLANAAESISTFSLVPVPLFIMMGALFFRSGLAVRVFDALDACFGRLPGRLSYVTVSGGTLFAALSAPVIPHTAEKMFAVFGLDAKEAGAWPTSAKAALGMLRPGHKLTLPDVLFKKIEDEQVAEWREKFGAPAE